MLLNGAILRGDSCTNRGERFFPFATVKCGREASFEPAYYKGRREN